MMPLTRNDVHRIMRIVSERQQENVEFLQQLVRVPTVNHPPRGNEKPAQEIIAHKLAEIGFQVDVFEPTEVPGIEAHPGWYQPSDIPRDYRGRPCVVGVMKGTGGGNSLILNGHIDVVDPGPRELWMDDPFSGNIRGGKIYGRGVVDMKGGIAAMIMAAECLKLSGYELEGDLVVESVVDEEMGGYNGTVACLARGYEADAAIITEPTRLKVEPGTKGAILYSVQVPGKSAHSNLWWRGVSALDKALGIKVALGAFERTRTKELRNHHLYGDQSIFPIPALVDTVHFVQCGMFDLLAVPDSCRFSFMLEVLPGEDMHKVSRRLEKHLSEFFYSDPFLREHRPKIEKVAMRPIKPSQMSLDHPIIPVVQKAFRAVKNSQPKVCGFESACDATIFNNYSKTPCLVFGPGDLSLAHRPDESLGIKELVDCTKILSLSIAQFCGHKP